MSATSESSPAALHSRSLSSSPDARKPYATIALTALFTIVIGLLYFVPPQISYGSDPYVGCRPLGSSLVGNLVTYGFPSHRGTLDAVDRSLENSDGIFDSNEELQARLGISEACNQARMNQQTTLFIVMGGALALLLGSILRRQTRLLRQVSSLALHSSHTSEPPQVDGSAFSPEDPK